MVKDEFCYTVFENILMNEVTVPALNCLFGYEKIIIKHNHLIKSKKSIVFSLNPRLTLFEISILTICNFLKCRG